MGIRGFSRTDRVRMRHAISGRHLPGIHLTNGTGGAASRLRGSVIFWALATLFLLMALTMLAPAAQAKYAAYVVDLDSGQVLHSVNADTRNYPASLTKMMTVYKVFQALESGRWRMSTRLRISRRAAGQPPSKLGLEAGSTITVHDAILALVVKSANDIAAAVAENYSGRERRFALDMTATARRLGMKRTTFRNASGLPNRGQLSTARDMAKLAAALYRDFPQYYHFFSQTRFTVDGREIKTHNNLLINYKGADGFKTGYIRASGFNLVASAKRHGKRLIGVVFGGRSAKSRDRRMARLLDKGFARVAQTAVAAATPTPTKPRAEQWVTRVTRTDDRRRTPSGHWGIQVGAFAHEQLAQDIAEKAVSTLPRLLEDGTIYVVPLKRRRGGTLHRARVYGLTKREAYRACRLLERRHMPCMELRVPDGVELASLEN